MLASYLEAAEVNLPPASIRLTVSTLLSLEDIRTAAKAVAEAAAEVFGAEEEVDDSEEQTEEETESDEAESGEE